MKAWKKWLVRTTLALTGLAILTVVGLSYWHAKETRKTATAYPAPGKFADVGGHRLHYHRVGEGNHKIIIDAGLSGGSYDFATIQEALAEVAEVCTYDRGGYGWSDHIPGPRTSQQIVSSFTHSCIAFQSLRRRLSLLGTRLAGRTFGYMQACIRRMSKH